MSTTIQALAQQSQTYQLIMLFDIVSVEDGTVLHVSQIGCSYGGNTYVPEVLSVTGFDVSLENSPLGIMAIPDIKITLGDANGSMTIWDNTHYFKGARLTATLVFWNPTTKAAASSNSQVIFKGICNAPDQSDPMYLSISAYSRFNAEFCLLPSDRISQFSQTIFPNDSAQDSDDANSATPANANSAGYSMLHAESVAGLPQHGAGDIYLPYFSCGYGPLRGTSGWSGGNPLGNFLVVSATATAGLCSSTTIGNSGASYPGSNGLANHLVAIVSGTGAGQIRRIASNTTTQITIANGFDVVPNGTSVFCVLYGACGKIPTDCQARGMYTKDSSSRSAYRNRGITFVPTNYHYHSHLLQTNAGVTTQAQYNSVIPLVYGTAMVPGLILFMQASSSVVYGELLVCAGPISGMSQLIVGNEVVPYNANYSFNNKATGQWTYRNGVIGNYFPDPYFTGKAENSSGSTPDTDILNEMAIIMLQIPTQFVGNADDFQASVVVNGLLIQAYDQNGNAVGSPSSTTNPAWIMLDILRRAGWQPSEINFPSFYAFSVYANQLIDLNISSTQTVLNPRFQISPTILQQAPASEVLRGVMAACRAILTYDSNGLIRIDCENRVANTTLQSGLSTGTQWAEVEDGSGITVGSVLLVGSGVDQETVTVLNVQLDGTGEYFQFQAVFANVHLTNDPVVAQYAYSFALSSIVQDGKGNPDLQRTSLPTAQTPNQFTVQFQDSFRAYVTDTVNLANVWESNQFGAPVIGTVGANGLMSVDAATRIAQLALFKAHGRRNSGNQILSRGNLFATFTSSVKAIGVGIGSFIQLSYLKEGWTNKAFRVVQISPTQDPQFPYWKIKLTVREHDDAWYDVINGAIAPPPSLLAMPLPPSPSSPRANTGPFLPLFN